MWRERGAPPPVQAAPPPPPPTTATLAAQQVGLGHETRVGVWGWQHASPGRPAVQVLSPGIRWRGRGAACTAHCSGSVKRDLRATCAPVQGWHLLYLGHGAEPHLGFPQAGNGLAPPPMGAAAMALPRGGVGSRYVNTLPQHGAAGGHTPGWQTGCWQACRPSLAY